MSIQELNDEQVRTWSLAKKDKWWLDNVYRGNMPQLNLRSALTGMVLGGVLSLTNLYVGIKTGWTLGVGITSVILSFAIFKVFSKLGIGKEMTVLENNAMQSVATSAGYMTMPLMASIPAYMLVTQRVIPMGQCIAWIIVLAILGVLFAFPLKKRFINDEQLPFPEGYAAGVVMDNLHTGDAKEGLFKAKLLMWGAGVSAFFEFVREENAMKAIGLKFLAIPEYWDDLIYKFWTPMILGTPLKDLTIRFESSVVMFATGGITGIKTGASLLTGAFVNYFILAPIMIRHGIIHGTGYKNITMWSLWGGVAMMTTASLYSFFSKPEMILQSFRLRAKKGQEDILKDIELPMSTFMWGIPVFGAITVYMAHAFFGIEYWQGVVALPLVFIFTLIAVHSTGLTSITPGNAIGKLTQLTFAVLAPHNISTNLMSSGISGEIALNASNLLMDIKPGYMLGGKPRHQAVGHILGIFAGTFIAVPVFYQIVHGDLSLLTSDKMPLPSAVVWRAVADVLMQGLSFLHSSAKIAVVVGAILGVAFEIINNRMKGKFPLSGVGIGLAFILPFFNSLAMGLGSVVFWYFGKKFKDPKTNAWKILVDNRETVCAGGIAGGSIIGIIIVLLETMK